ncbi:MAG: hypothetical protein HFG78_03960 [Hungatella sp.]|nr:hypothetical protein [Hungatella sp.]
MEKQVEGKCKYCGREYTRGYIIRHLSSCKERKTGWNARRVIGNGAIREQVYGKWESLKGWFLPKDRHVPVFRGQFSL